MCQLFTLQNLESCKHVLMHHLTFADKVPKCQTPALSSSSTKQTKWAISSHFICSQKEIMLPAADRTTFNAVLLPPLWAFELSLNTQIRCHRVFTKTMSRCCLSMSKERFPPLLSLNCSSFVTFIHSGHHSCLETDCLWQQVSEKVAKF